MRITPRLPLALVLGMGMAAGRLAAAEETRAAVAPSLPPPPAADAPTGARGGSESSVPMSSVEILFHADLDGRLATTTCARSADGGPSLGYASLVGRLVTVRDAAVAGQRPPPIVLLGGNIATPDLFGASLVERGPAGIDALVAILGGGRYDAVALGHHELSLGAGELARLVSALGAAGMPVVVTNLRCDARVRAPCPPVKQELLLERGGISVGVVATVSPAVVPGIPAATFRGLTLDDPAEAARAAIRRLRGRGAQAVVLMAQGPRNARALDQVDALSRQLATSPVEERPDVILAGGLAGELDDRAIRSLRRVGAPPVAGAPSSADGLTRILLAAGPEVASASGDRVTIETVPSAGAPADAATAARLAAELTTTCAAYCAPVGPAPVRGTLTREAFTRYVLEILRRRAGAEIALINRAFVKGAPFPLRGPLTRADLRRALPFRAVVGSGRVSGAAVDSALGPAVDKEQLAVVGLARSGSGLRVNGRALDKARAYRVATIAFVADGGDGLIPAGAIPWHALPGEPEVRVLVEDFLGHHTADRDGDPSIDAATDFGPPVAERPLVVALGDVGLDLTSTSIANAPSYTDAQLVRASQLAVTGNATGVVQVRDRVHEADVRLDVKYGWSRTQPVGAAATSAETADLITFSTVYNFRGLRGAEALLKRTVPDPFVRVRLESEITRPEVTPTQPRTYHHAQMTNTAGLLFTALPKLRLRAGAGAQAELLASGADGAWLAVLEAGGTLDPVAVATFGPLAVKVEGLVDYDFVNPTGLRQHQVRGSGKVSVPLLPALFITVGVNVFAVQREGHGWGSAADVVAGVRIHQDLAYQGL